MMWAILIKIFEKCTEKLSPRNLMIVICMVIALVAGIGIEKMISENAGREKAYDVPGRGTVRGQMVMLDNDMIQRAMGAWEREIKVREGMVAAIQNQTTIIAQNNALIQELHPQAGWLARSKKYADNKANGSVGNP